MILGSVVPHWKKSLMASTTSAKNDRDFDPKKFLATIGEGRRVVTFPKKKPIFAQGDAADAVFYIQEAKFDSQSYPRLAGSNLGAY